MKCLITSLQQQQSLRASQPSCVARHSAPKRSSGGAVVRASAHTPSRQQEPCPASPAPASRRQLLGAASLAPGLLALGSQPAQAAAKPPKGFNPFEDTLDGYKFLYPFGWQEVAVDGVDVLFKDIVEPLESISVTINNTEKQSVTDFGGIQEVADTLAKQVLTAPGNEVTVLNTEERETNNRKYYEFEFIAKNPRYTRHSLAVVAAANGKFYTLATGANERRWGKIGERLKTSIRSFTLLY